MTNAELDALRRELLIAAAASRKLATALTIAWAGLTDTRFSSSKSVTRGDAPADAQKKERGTDQVPLPF